MKKIKLALFPRVLIAIAAGALLGLVLPDFAIRILKTFNLLIAQILKFIVPLLVIGLVTPAIASLGKGAGKMLLVTMLIAYASTVCASLFAYGCASPLLPHYINTGEITSSTQSFKPYMELKIPPICDVLTALLISFITGTGIIFTKAEALKKGFAEFGGIIKLTIEKFIIPLLPIYIFTMICEMSAAGVIGAIMGTGIKIILTGICLSIIYLIIQYCIAGSIAGKNPFKCLWTMAPAYFTGFSICSSSAVIPVTLDCTVKNGVSREIAGFSVPLCANVHMVGSAIKLAVSSIAVAYISGTPINFPVFLEFALVQAVAAIAAPGVMGGVLMASLGLMDSVLGFTPDQTALVMTLYLALDGYGPAANVTGDGAIALVLNRFFRKRDE